MHGVHILLRLAGKLFALGLPEAVPSCGLSIAPSQAPSLTSRCHQASSDALRRRFSKSNVTPRGCQLNLLNTDIIFSFMMPITLSAAGHIWKGNEQARLQSNLLGSQEPTSRLPWELWAQQLPPPVLLKGCSRQTPPASGGEPGDSLRLTMPGSTFPRVEFRNLFTIFGSMLRRGDSGTGEIRGLSRQKRQLENSPVISRLLLNCFATKVVYKAARTAKRTHN